VDTVTTPKLRKHARIGSDDRAQAAATLLQRYEAGSSIRNLAADTGYSITRVRKLLEEAGVRFRSRGGANRKGAKAAG
jgi:hypothetical protein